MNAPDILIVGAGPAGLSATRELLRGGARVLVVERHEAPGGKACGGGLTREAWALAGLAPRAGDPRTRVFDRLGVRTPLGSVTIGMDAPGLAIVDRVEWTARFVEELADLGARIKLGERLVSCGDGLARTDRSPISYGSLVGADGAVSRIRRLVGLPRGVAIKALQMSFADPVPGSSVFDAEQPWVCFDPRRFGDGGYGWSFPAPGGVRIGCGSPAGTRRERGLKGAFLSWVRELGLNPDRGELRSGTIGCGYLGHRFGRVFLAGDAAGLASPVTGEGIMQALLSGREVAREILDSSYRSPIISQLAVRHRRTFETLNRGPVGGALSLLAPLLLRIPAVRREALRRYVGG